MKCSPIPTLLTLSLTFLLFLFATSTADILDEQCNDMGVLNQTCFALRDKVAKCNTLEELIGGTTSYASGLAADAKGKALEAWKKLDDSSVSFSADSRQCVADCNAAVVGTAGYLRAAMDSIKKNDISSGAVKTAIKNSEDTMEVYCISSAACRKRGSEGQVAKMFESAYSLHQTIAVAKEFRPTKK